MQFSKIMSYNAGLCLVRVIFSQGSPSKVFAISKIFLNMRCEYMKLSGLPGLSRAVFFLLTVFAVSAAQGAPVQTWTLERTIEGFSIPVALAMDKAGNIYVSNWGGDTVSKIDAEGGHSEFARGIRSPSGSAFDPEGNFYVASYGEGVVYRVNPQGHKEIFSRGFHTPTGLTLHSGGGLLVTNRNIGELVKVEPDGRNKVLRDGFNTAAGVLEGPNGEIYVANFDGGVSRLTIEASGRVAHKTISQAFAHPAIGLFLDGETLYVVDHGEGSVKRILSDGRTETVAAGIPSAVGMLRMPDGRVIVTSWGGKLFVFRTPLAPKP